MALVLPAVLCVGSGFALASVGWPRGTGPAFLLRASLAVPLGLGVFSVVFFVARVLGLANLLVADLAVFGLLAALVSWLSRRGRSRLTGVLTEPRADSKELTPSAHTSTSGALTAAFVASVGAALYSAVVRTLAHPQGSGWDAFAIWNLHARFLFRGGEHWRDGFSSLIGWSHPDYPLLLPAAVAHFWTLSGRDHPSVPAMIGLLFTFSTVGLLCSALFMMRGQNAAMLGGMALASTPAFVDLGTWQYADVPLSFFFLATVVFLCLCDEIVWTGHVRADGLLVLAGLSAGFAAWTKNEGVLFLCATVLALVWSRAREPGRGPSGSSTVGRSSLLPLLAALAPMVLLIICFKRFVAAPGDLFTDPGTMLHRLQEPGRYWAVLKWYAIQFFRFGRWMLLPGTVLLIGYYFAAEKRDAPRNDVGFRTSVVALALTLAGYFAVYLITPLDIYWHLRFSLDRLFLQVWPSTIFLSFLGAMSARPAGTKPALGVKALP